MNSEQLTAEAVGFECSSVFEACGRVKKSEGWLMGRGKVTQGSPSYFTCPVTALHRPVECTALIKT